MPFLPYRLKVRLVPSSRDLVVDELIFALAEAGRPLLPVQLVQQRLGIERLHVAGPAGHEQEDDRLRLGFVRHVRRLGRQRIDRGAAPSSCCSIAPNASAPNPQKASDRNSRRLRAMRKCSGM